MRIEKKKLPDLCGQLGEQRQETLLAFGEFLVTRPGLANEADRLRPRAIQRPVE